MMDDDRRDLRFLRQVVESGALADHPFTLIDVGCALGIDPVWRLFGDDLRAYGFDPQGEEIDRLTAEEESPRIEYIARFVGLPEDHPFRRAHLDAETPHAAYFNPFDQASAFAALAQRNRVTEGERGASAPEARGATPVRAESAARPAARPAGRGASGDGAAVDGARQGAAAHAGDKGAVDGPTAIAAVGALGVDAPRVGERGAVFRAKRPERATRATDDWASQVLAADRISLTEFVRQRGIRDVDFVKIDTDGSDLEVALSSRDIIRECDVLGYKLEGNFVGSLSETENSWRNIDRFMKEQGFLLYDLSPYRYSRAALPSPFSTPSPYQTVFGQPIWGDFVYLRNGAVEAYRTIWGSELTVPKLLKLACLYELFGLPDCAAELIVKFRGAIADVADPDALLDALTPPFKGGQIRYVEYLAQFERSYESFFPAPWSAGGKEVVRRQREVLRQQREVVKGQRQEIARLRHELERAAEEWRLETAGWRGEVEARGRELAWAVEERRREVEAWRREVEAWRGELAQSEDERRREVEAWRREVEAWRREVARAEEELARIEEERRHERERGGEELFLLRRRLHVLERAASAGPIGGASPSNAPVGASEGAPGDGPLYGPATTSGVRFGGASPFSRLKVHEGAATSGDDPLLITTPRERWAYAASLRVGRKAARTPGRSVVWVVLRVTRGVIQVGAIGHDNELIAEAERAAADGPTAVALPLVSLAECRAVVFRNAAPDDTPSEAEVWSMSVEEYPPREDSSDSRRADESQGPIDVAPPPDEPILHAAAP